MTYTEAGEDRIRQLVLAKDSGLEPPKDLVASVRASYLLGLRKRMQDPGPVRDAVIAASPATDAHEAVERGSWDLVREGAEDLFRDAIMFLLAELDELRKGGDQAYVVDMSTGEIVAPLSEDIVFHPDPYVHVVEVAPGVMESVTVTPSPMLDPELTAAMIMGRAVKNREDEVRDLASDPVTGRAYLHLTDPQRIGELAKKSLEDMGLSHSDSVDGEELTVEFGHEADEADVQAVNPFFHRLWSYSAVVARRVASAAAPGRRFRLGPVRGHRDDGQRWYSVVAHLERPQEAGE